MKCFDFETGSTRTEKDDDNCHTAELVEAK